jgi:hypothetical protein
VYGIAEQFVAAAEQPKSTPQVSTPMLLFGELLPLKMADLRAKQDAAMQRIIEKPRHSK